MKDGETVRSGVNEMSLGLRLICAAFVLWLAAQAVLLHSGRFSDFTAWLLFAQDRWLLLAGALALVVASVRLPHRGRALCFSRSTWMMLALLAIPLCYAGHIWVLCDYDVSRDEQLAVFDSRIFAQGLFVQPLAPGWREHTAALNNLFTLEAVHPVAWVSAYLPVNAALRAMVGLFVDPALTGPILTAIGAVALWKCARRIWPGDREAATVALLLYLASGQVLVTGMTAYAMPAHLTFNLLWLWLFLIDRRWSDVAALALGALAVGIHQPLFHPLFVAPFILLLIYRRAWFRAAFFVIAYLCIGAFWYAWPHWMYALVEVGHPTTPPAQADFLARLHTILAGHAGSRWADMTSNLLRFVAWQPVLLLPLFAVGLTAARRDALAVTLAVASILPIIVMGVLIPDQGQGIGYRYLHGVIGAIILVAIFGWREAVSQDGHWRPLLARTLLLGLFAILPAQLIMTYVYQHSLATTDGRIEAAGTDYFIIGNDDAPLANSLVTNRADLTNRPIRLFADKLDANLVQMMCAHHGEVGMPTSAFYAPINRYFMQESISRSADRRIRKVAPALEARGCRVRIFG